MFNKAFLFSKFKNPLLFIVLILSGVVVTYANIYLNCVKYTSNFAIIRSVCTELSSGESVTGNLNEYILSQGAESITIKNNTGDKNYFIPYNTDKEALSFFSATKTGQQLHHESGVTDGVEICVDGKHFTDGVDIDGIAGDDISGCHNSKYSVGEWDSCSNAELSRSVLCYDDLDDDDQYELLSPDNEPTIVNSACLGAVPIGKQDLPSSCITSNDCTTNGIIATCTGYQPAGTGYCTTSFGIADQPCVNNTSPSNCFSQTGQRDACTWDANELNPAEKCKNTIYNINEINCGDYNDSAANCSLQTVSRQGACAWQSGNSAIPGSCACSDGVFTWVLGDWSVCSASCGGGNQTRTVECHDSAGNTVSDSLCSGAAPAVTQACNTQSCPGGSVSACGICSSTSQCPSGHNCQALQGGDSFCEPSGGPACMQ